ncbi:sodium-dependent neutral amino acid transporter B(0)AT2 [Silurus meridionalis]|nr:sodium-dependent neutral amino acid transporter B(0)AT2 [Silurus meridionalis]XP_046720520.1 sodium-dependent neutral amino acid transporter B(0)AT2 [Silurus meridionalis]XP_046720521.1 sodium-dependent neutral amino acid transporter B(0)AT2 [Silurus meridionalis]
MHSKNYQTPKGKDDLIGIIPSKESSKDKNALDDSFEKIELHLMHVVGSKERKIEEAACEREADNEGKERDAWSSKFQYILAQVGFSVGLGNVWRFPYLCQKNGGGAFLLPYVILLFLIGIPLFFLELAVGQRMRRGSIGIWNYISPRLGGLGFASCLTCLFVGLYYNVIIGWSVYYLSQSFTKNLPWQHCPVIEGNVVPECEKSSATTYYWYREALNISDTISESGGIIWKMALCLMGAWVMVCLGMIKGIQSSGKVMYFSSLFPYLVLFSFMVRSLLLEGSVDGIIHMFTPKVEIMLDPKVWREAATQVFFALGLGFGGVIAFSSFNKRNNNCHFDAILVPFINFFTSVLATVVVFAVLGFKANVKNTACVNLNTEKIVGYVGNDVSPDLIPTHIDLTSMTADSYHELIKIFHDSMGDGYAGLGLDPCDIKEELNQAVQGTGLAFIAFTEAITFFPVAPFWSFMFFFMLLNLGLGSMFGTIEGIITPLVDTFKIRKEILTVGCCLLSFFVGLIFVQRSGNYFVSMFDDYSATLPLLIVVLMENLAVAWVYGSDKFFEDLKQMLGFAPYRIYYYMWKYITPLLLLVLLIASVVQMAMSPPSYTAWIQEEAKEQSVLYPPWGMAMCFLLFISAILPIPVVFIFKYFKLCSKNNRSSEHNNNTDSQTDANLTD